MWETVSKDNDGIYIYVTMKLVRICLKYQSFAVVRSFQQVLIQNHFPINFQYIYPTKLFLPSLWSTQTEIDPELNQYYVDPFTLQWELELMHIEIYCTRHHKFPCEVTM